MKQIAMFLLFVLAGCASQTPTEPYRFIIIPDTQNYTKYAKNQDNFVEMTRWISENREKLNIVLVLQEGDLVEQNEIDEGGGRGYGDQTGLQQWQAAKRAIRILDGQVPYVLCTGNHDYGLRNAEDRRTHFNTFFAPTDNPLNSDGRGGGILREMGFNAFGARTLENASFELTAPDGRRFLILSLEWGPREQTVQWAKSVAARPEYANHTAILLTHTYLNHDDTYDTSPNNYPTKYDTHDGQALWDKLVGPSNNIQMVFNGHIGGDQVGYRVDTNAGGQDVHQMLFNAQFHGGGSREQGNGGDGWLRIVTFKEDGRSVHVQTYSPLLDAWGQEAWRTDPANDFVFTIDPIR